MHALVNNRLGCVLYCTYSVHFVHVNYISCLQCKLLSVTIIKVELR